NQKIKIISSEVYPVLVALDPEYGKLNSINQRAAEVKNQYPYSLHLIKSYVYEEGGSGMHDLNTVYVVKLNIIPAVSPFSNISQLELDALQQIIQSDLNKSI